MAEYVNYKIDEIGSSIRNGCISINPYEKGDRSACTYCDYRSVCGFDNRIPGYEKRILPGLSKEEAEEKMADHIRKQNEELRQASLFNYNIIDNIELAQWLRLLRFVIKKVVLAKQQRQ